MNELCLHNTGKAAGDKAIDEILKEHNITKINNPSV